MDLSSSIPQLTELWALTAPLAFIQKTATYVYSSVSDRPIILKLTHPWRRAAEVIAAEVEWVDYLAQSGVPVAAPIRSKNGNLTEQVGEFTVTAFEFAVGHLSTADDLSPGAFVKLGRLLGHLHNVTTRYPIKEEDSARINWRGQIWPIVDRLRDLDVDYSTCDEIESLAKELSARPKRADTFGLVHGDLHPNNFFVTNRGEITLFDFDACCYHWFLYDFATTLLHTQEYCESHGVTTGYLHDSLLTGYLEERPLDTTDLPLFLRLRALVFTNWATLQLHASDPDPHGRAWINRVLPWMRQRLHDL